MKELIQLNRYSGYNIAKTKEKEQLLRASTDEEL